MTEEIEGLRKDLKAEQQKLKGTLPVVMRAVLRLPRRHRVVPGGDKTAGLEGLLPGVP